MNSSSLFVRFAGRPLVALPLLLGCVIFVMGWFHGQVSWVMGLLALWLGLQTVTAVRRRRAYKAWEAQWRAMGTLEEPARPASHRRPRWGRSLISAALTVTAAILALLIPVYLSAPSMYTSQLIIIWLLALLYLGVKLARRLRRRKNATACADEVVTWLLGRASSSPSPAEAMKALPEYSARLLLGSNQRPQTGRIAVAAD